MQKRFCSQTFTVCRTLLLWELIFVQVEGKKKHLLFHWIVSRLGAFASWELLTWGHLLWYFLFCTVVPWSVWNALGNFTVKPGYMHFMPDFCVYKQSENSLVHKQQLQSQHFFSLHMCKFATIYLSDAKSHLRLLSVPDLDTSYFLDEVQLTQS